MGFYFNQWDTPSQPSHYYGQFAGPDELEHYGRKGMKWYQHLFGKEDSRAAYNKTSSSKEGFREIREVKPEEKNVMFSSLKIASAQKKTDYPDASESRAVLDDVFARLFSHADDDDNSGYGESIRNGMETANRAQQAKASKKLTKFQDKEVSRLLDKMNSTSAKVLKQVEDEQDRVQKYQLDLMKQAQEAHKKGDKAKVAELQKKMDKAVTEFNEVKKAAGYEIKDIEKELRQVLDYTDDDLKAENKAIRQQKMSAAKDKYLGFNQQHGKNANDYVLDKKNEQQLRTVYRRKQRGGY